MVFEGELRDGEDVKGVSEQVAVRLEDLADVRLVSVRQELCGCLICRHGAPIDESWWRKVHCVKKKCVCGALDCCDAFEPIPMQERLGNPDVDRRIEKFNKLFKSL